MEFRHWDTEPRMSTPFPAPCAPPCAIVRCRAAPRPAAGRLELRPAPPPSFLSVRPPPPWSASLGETPTSPTPKIRDGAAWGISSPPPPSASGLRLARFGRRHRQSPWTGAAPLFFGLGHQPELASPLRWAQLEASPGATVPRGIF
jgi:hypothetical protein